MVRRCSNPTPSSPVDYGIFSVRQARDAGYSRADIEGHVRRGRWNRLERGVLLAEGRELRPGDDLVLALARAGPGAVAGFESAAFVHGWDAVDRPPKPQRILPRHGSRGVGYRADLTADEVTLRGIVLLTAPARTALDVACRSRFIRSVVVLDSALRSEQTALPELRRWFASSQRDGIVAARAALDCTDPMSGSVAETEARLLFAAAGLPAPTTQLRISTGRGIVRLDFAWEGAKVAVEIDGFLYHSASGDFQRDRTKQNAVQLDGWLILRFTVRDIRERPDEVIAILRRALSSSA